LRSPVLAIDTGAGLIVARWRDPDGKSTARQRRDGPARFTRAESHGHGRPQPRVREPHRCGEPPGRGRASIGRYLTASRWATARRHLRRRSPTMTSGRSHEGRAPVLESGGGGWAATTVPRRTKRRIRGFPRRNTGPEIDSSVGARQSDHTSPAARDLATVAADCAGAHGKRGRGTGAPGGPEEPSPPTIGCRMRGARDDGVPVELGNFAALALAEQRRT